MVVANDVSLLQRNARPQCQEIEQHYTRVWGIEGPDANLKRGSAETIAVACIFWPVTPQEVANRVKRIANDSAPGPDDVKKVNLRGANTHEALSKLFNAILLTGHYPKAWKANRTTLLPKTGKDLADVRNWRPITISSMVSRTFSGLLDQRLRATFQQTIRQKGFTDDNGCYENFSERPF